MSKKPVPSKKQARSSTRSRFAKYAYTVAKKLRNKYLVFDTCPETGEIKRKGFASPSGRYKGRQVFVRKSGKAPIQEIKA